MENTILLHGIKVNEEKGTVKAYSIKPEMLESQSNEAAKELRLIESQMQQINWVQDLV